MKDYLTNKYISGNSIERSKEGGMRKKRERFDISKLINDTIQVDKKNSYLVKDYFGTSINLVKEENLEEDTTLK